MTYHIDEYDKYHISPSTSVNYWRENVYDLAKKPTIFAIGKIQ